MSAISKEVREAKDSSKQKRSKTRPRVLSPGTDVNKLTTSKFRKLSSPESFFNFEEKSEKTICNHYCKHYHTNHSWNKNLLRFI